MNHLMVLHVIIELFDPFFKFDRWSLDSKNILWIINCVLNLAYVFLIM